jgi:PAS domain S-box-containing protein
VSKKKSNSSAQPAGARQNKDAVLLALKDRALAAAAEGITIADLRQPDQPLIYANEGFERLTLYPISEVIGKNCRFLQGEDTDPATVESIRSAISERKECTVELVNYRQDGSRFWNRLSLTPIDDESGKTTHYIGIQTNITARREAEEALRQANRDLENTNLQMKRNLQAAARIQQSLLPEELPRVERFRFAWLYEPSEELAGDTLNLFPLDERHIALYTLDVSGHGVPAALLSVTLSHWLSPTTGRSTLAVPDSESPSGVRIVSPCDVARVLNQQFPMDLETAQYFTLLYGVLDAERAELSYVSAGSPPIVHAPRLGKPHFEIVPGFPIGIVAEPGYQQQKIRLDPGDRLYFYTDGVPDAMNSKGDDFGTDRLVNVIAELAELPLEESLTAIIDQIRDWAGEEGIHDDATILGVEYSDT